MMVTEHNADVSSLFEIQSVAIVGASEEPGRIGSGLYKSIADSFAGPVYCVNPRYDVLWGSPCYQTVLDLPETPSHAVIAVARQYVPGVLKQCADKGITNVVVISAGFKETDAAGAELEAEIAQICAQRKITLLGPNTLGFIDTSVPYNGTFLPEHYEPGAISVISQSGGVGMAVLSALQDQRCGIRRWVGIGNETVLDAVALLKYFAEDPGTKAIGVCFEGLRDLPGFLRLAQKVNRSKPIVLLRDGKGAVGMQAAASHTGTMAAETTVMRGLIRQFGLTEAASVRECAAMLKVLSIADAPSGDRVALLTNTAGPSILAADALDTFGVKMPMTSPMLRDAIDREIGVSMQLKNPADISSTSLIPKNYGIAARHLLMSEEYDLLLGFFSLSSHLILPDQELTDAVRQAGKPTVACFLGTQARFAGYDRMPEQYGIPCYYDPNDAAAAVAALVNWGRARRQPEKTQMPALPQAQRTAVAAYLDTLPDGILSEQETRSILRLAGAPVEIPVVTDSLQEAIAAADAMGYPVVLKLHSHVITHKSDVGGVQTDISTRKMLTEAYHRMLSDMKNLDPEAKLSVQRQYAAGSEWILGGVWRQGTGPVVMAGLGGVYAEVLSDTGFCQAPADICDTEQMLNQLRCAPVFSGFRGEALDKTALAELAALVSQLIDAFPRIRELEINPCRVYNSGIAVLDARAVLKKS